jgi:hypothetical protein
MVVDRSDRKLIKNHPGATVTSHPKERGGNPERERVIMMMEGEW